MRIIKIIFLLLLLLIAGLFAARLYLLEQIAIYALDMVGAKVVSLHISDTGWHQTHIADLRATFNTDPDRQFPVHLKDISLGYHLPKLLTTGQCTKISVKTMAISLDDRSKNPKSHLQLPEHINLLSREQRTRLPVQNIHIAELQLSGILPQLNTLPLEIKADLKDGVLSATITAQTHDTVVSMELHSPNPNHGTLRIMGQHLHNSLIQADLRLQPEQVTGTFALQAGPVQDILQQLMNLNQLPELSAELEGNFSIQRPEGRDTTFSINTRAENFIFGDLQASSALLQATGTLQSKSIHLAPKSQFQVSSLTMGGLTVQQLAADLAGTFIHSPTGLTCILDQSNTFQLKKLTTDTLHIDKLTLQADKHLQLSVRNNEWSMAENTLKIAPLSIREGTRQYTTGPVLCRRTSLHSQQKNFLVSSKITTPSFIFTNGVKTISLKQLSGALQLSDNNLKSTWNFSPAVVSGTLQGTVSHDFSTAAGSFRLQTKGSLDLNRDEVAISKLFTPWGLPFDLNKGTLTGKATGSWARNKKTQLALSFQLKQGAGFYKHFLFNGLESSQNFAILPRMHSKTPGNIFLEHLTGGIDLDTITTSIEFQPSEQGSLPAIKINDFNASLFDGTLNSPAILYDLNTLESNFSINMNNINMEPLIALLHQNNLQVSGRLSGTLPIQIINKKISVINGELHNEPPGGEIRYTPGNLNQQGIAGYALKAVEDFHYDSLRATAMYAPSGQLDLDIHLQGISPLLDEKRPVHLNIHAEQNLPDLLESLRFSKGLIEKLDKRIERQYK